MIALTAFPGRSIAEPLSSGSTLTLTVRTGRTTYYLGEPVVIDVQVRNDGESPAQITPLDLEYGQLDVRVRDPQGHELQRLGAANASAPWNEAPESATPPGGSRESSFLLSHLFDVYESAGEYQIVVTYPIFQREPTDRPVISKLVVQSGITAGTSFLVVLPQSQAESKAAQRLGGAISMVLSGRNPTEGISLFDRIATDYKNSYLAEPALFYGAYYCQMSSMVARLGLGDPLAGAHGWEALGENEGTGCVKRYQDFLESYPRSSLAALAETGVRAIHHDRLESERLATRRRAIAWVSQLRSPEESIQDAAHGAFLEMLTYSESNLIGILTDKNYMLASNRHGVCLAVDLLGILRSRKAVPYLTDIIDYCESNMPKGDLLERYPAAMALAAIGVPAVADVLAKAIDTAQPRVRELCERVLVEILGQEDAEGGLAGRTARCEVSPWSLRNGQESNRRLESMDQYSRTPPASGTPGSARRVCRGTSMNRRHIAALATLLMLPWSAPATGGEMGLVIPTDLNDVAKSRGCSPPADFFSRRPRAVDPPYVYGLSGSVDDWSAAFWCIRNSGEDKEPVLMLYIPDDGKVPGGCPSEIVGLPPVGGLSIVSSENRALDEFWTVSKPRRKGATGVKLARGVLRSSYDGIGADFYCHDGEWYYSPFE